MPSLRTAATTRLEVSLFSGAEMSVEARAQSSRRVTAAALQRTTRNIPRRRAICARELVAPAIADSQGARRAGQGRDGEIIGAAKRTLDAPKRSCRMFSRSDAQHRNIASYEAFSNASLLTPNNVAGDVHSRHARSRTRDSRRVLIGVKTICRLSASLRPSRG